VIVSTENSNLVGSVSRLSDKLLAAFIILSFSKQPSEEHQFNLSKIGVQRIDVDDLKSQIRIRPKIVRIHSIIQHTVPAPTESNPDFTYFTQNAPNIVDKYSKGDGAPKDVYEFKNIDCIFFIKILDRHTTSITSDGG
jgi:hypothetical protein